MLADMKLWQIQREPKGSALTRNADDGCGRNNGKLTQDIGKKTVFNMFKHLRAQYTVKGIGREKRTDIADITDDVRLQGGVVIEGDDLNTRARFFQNVRNDSVSGTDEKQTVRMKFQDFINLMPIGAKTRLCNIVFKTVVPCFDLNIIFA